MHRHPRFKVETPRFGLAEFRRFKRRRVSDERLRESVPLQATALVYPAFGDCPPGRITEFVLMTEERPMLEIVAVDVRELAFGSGIPVGIDGMIPMERHWK